ncbi:MAG TPA: uracil-DNA glycosylase family protein [Solirubrobacteraceae bacterium]|nr:uracil-DNA glycosylase family protein [Solirubrobacteraceae bacterium]
MGSSPADLARSWERCAYLQSVKCSPHGNRSNPTGAMCRACPPFLLKEELEILAPRAVILLGRTSVRDIIRPMLTVRWGESPGHFERDEFALSDGGPVHLFSCNHPSTPNRAMWRASLDELIASLQSECLTKTS